MNHETAAEIRDELNRMGYVEGPDDSSGDHNFSLTRVRQPGYLNGEPMYEVLLDVTDEDHVCFPSHFLELVTEHGCYLRVTDGVVHIRDWDT